VLVRDHAVVDLESGIGREPSPGRDADADNHEVALDHIAHTRKYARDRAIALERIDPMVEEHLDAVLDVHVAVERADLGTQDALVGQLQRIDDSYVEATLARRGCKLAADPAGADHGDAGAVHQLGPQHIAVGERPQVVNAFQGGARHLDPSRLGSRGQQQPVVRQLLSVTEGHARGLRVDRRHGRARLKLDVVLGVEVGRVHVRLLALGLAAEVLLGQRRALVGPLGLGADQDDPPVEAAVAQLLSRLGAGQAGADDHECLLTHRIFLPVKVGYRLTLVSPGGSYRDASLASVSAPSISPKSRSAMS